MSPRSLADVWRFIGVILGPEDRYFALVLIYGVGISLLSLATPISVQLLINTVAYTGLITPLIILSLALFVLLVFASLLNALRIHLMDLFSRRFYARIVSEIALRAIYAVNPHFEDSGEGALFNRYFDAIIVTKTVPYLLVGGFTIVLQTLVGFVLVSLYHPLFLAFSVVLVLLIWSVWLIWGRRAMRSAVELSHRKHAVAAWLEGLGDSNGFFKSERHIDYALAHTDAMTDRFISQQRLHFRHHFSQTLALLLLYAASSALLLGLGGWLVIQGELSIGQLVAAELVLSVVFVGISQLGLYLTYFYDLCAAIDELALFYDVDQEKFSANRGERATTGDLAFSQATMKLRGEEVRLDFAIPAGARVLVHADQYGPVRAMNGFLKGHESPASGFATLGGIDMDAIPQHTQRQQIIVLDRPNAIDMSMREFLELSGRDGDPGLLLETLQAVGLEDTVGKLDAGLDTRITASGWPLSIAENMQLKLASAIIAQPNLLVLNQLYDMMPEAQLRAALDLLTEVTQGQTTIMVMSSSEPDLGCDHWLLLEARSQLLFSDFDSFSDRIQQGLAPRVPASEGV
ncbi:MAG: ABC transporter transmembrane domain-containing protein [Pseudomonadota bacterium]